MDKPWWITRFFKRHLLDKIVSVYLKSEKIIKEWVDYNNHLNMTYYVLIFDQACEVLLEKFKMGAESAKTEKRSTMVVETNTKYISEVKEGNEIDTMLTFFDHDKKRLHLKLEIIVKKTKKISASIEWLSLYINLETRKVTEFENKKVAIMNNFIEQNKNNFNYEDIKFSSKLKKWK